MNQFQVQRIVGKRTTKKGDEYQVEWKNYPKEDSTWEPAKNLGNCREMIDEYNANIKAQKERDISTGKFKGSKVSPSRVLTGKKSVKISEEKKQMKMKKKPVSQQQEQDQQEVYNGSGSEEETAAKPPNLKRQGRLISAPMARKSSRFTKTAAPMPDQQNQFEQQAQQEKEPQKPNNVGKVVSNGSQKQKEFNKASFQIIGMYQSDQEYFYKLKGKSEVMSRTEVLKKDPIALVLFYESNLKVSN